MEHVGLCDLARLPKYLNTNDILGMHYKCGVASAGSVHTSSQSSKKHNGSFGFETPPTPPIRRVAPEHLSDPMWHTKQLPIPTAFN